jgi:hypothetical protein
VSTIGLGKSLLLPAAKVCKINRVPLVCRGIVGVKCERPLEFSLPADKIPLVVDFVSAQNGMRMCQGGSNSSALRAAAFDFG